MKNQKAFKKVELHPESIKQLRKGHPWIIKDRFTEKFPKDVNFLVGTDKNNRSEFLLLNDFLHSKVKARLWANEGSWHEVIQNFPKDLEMRIIESLKIRLDLNLFNKRENVYWVFGEADFLPGLFIQQLKNGLFVQVTSQFWIQKKSVLLKTLKRIMNQFPQQKIQWMSFQDRQDDQNSLIEQWFGNCPKEFSVKESDFQVLVRMNQHHDIGLYTDMASIREKLSFQSLNFNKTLNLFSYTGAYSLWAHTHGAKEITSVDVSKEYMTWFEQNVELNQFDSSLFKNILSDVHTAISSLKKEKQKFDLIIYDPPTLASDGEKTLSASSHYKRDLPILMELLSPQGSLVVFNNTHSISKSKFEKLLVEVTSKNKNIRSGLSLSLGDDCPQKKGFPEGSYLKGKIFHHKG